MDGISFCPFRQNINVQTTEFTEPVTFRGQVQVQQLTAPVTFTGTVKDLELLEACREGANLKRGRIPVSMARFLLAC
jgi:hypothetical protein